MKVRLTIDLDVGDDPTADAISYFVRKYGTADPDDWHSPEEWAEQAAHDAIEQCLLMDHEGPTTHWHITGSLVEHLVGD